jgi:3-hydroxyisobutyrate dehydrogenase-like beta-hydroxyacid dehydrogenase
MKVGFIGLGLMGRGMAANIQKAGYELVVHDLFRQAASQHLENGATWAATPKEVAERCDLVLTSLPTPVDVEKVGFGEDGLASGFRKGAAWFDLSTNAVDVVRSLHARLAPMGVDFFDAPVSGGPGGAASGKLALWVGGDKAAYDKYETVIKAMGDQARYIGDIGAGTIAKLVHNLSSAVITQALAECFTMGIKAGLEPLALWEAVRQGAMGRMRTYEMWGNRVLPGKFETPSFQLRLLNKDVQLALQLGRDVAVPMRLSNLTGLELTEAMNRGWGTLDSQAYVMLQQERAGIPKIEIPADKIRAVVEKG